MKKALAMAMSTCLLATSMVGCGGNTKPAAADNTNAAGETAASEGVDTSSVLTDNAEIRFCWWGGDDRHTATLKAIDLFQEKYPNIKVKAEYGGWDGHAEKITTQMTGGTAADVLQVNYDWLSRLSKDGTGFMNLESFGDLIKLDNFEEEDLAFGRRKGILNAIPVSTTGRSIYYNKTTYDQLGVALPTTWEELIATGEAFSKTAGYYPFDLDTGSGFPAWYLCVVYMQQKTGKDFITEDGQIGFTQEEIQEALEFFKTLEDNKVIRTQEQRANEAGTTPLYQTPSWLDGKVAGVLEWSSSIGKYEAALAEKGQELAIGNLLSVDGATNVGWFKKPSLMYAITPTTKAPAASALFLDFMLNDQEAAKILGTTRGIPSSKAASAALDGTDELQGAAYEGTKQINECGANVMSPYFENALMKEVYNEAIQSLSYGQGTVEEIAANMYSQLQDTLASVLQ